MRFFLGRYQLVRMFLSVLPVTALNSCAHSLDEQGAGTHHIVEIRGFEFHPRTLEVADGDRITWVNLDIVPHTATASLLDSDIAGAGTGGFSSTHWDTGAISNAQSAEVIWGKGLGLEYFCLYHPGMRGLLVSGSNGQSDSALGFK